MLNYHLAILKKPYLDLLLDGSKTVESRFTKTRREPFGRIAPGDHIFLKLSSGPVCAAALVSNVKSFSSLTPQKIVELKNQYNHLILADDEYWQAKADSRFGLLLWLRDITPIKPIRIDKKDWRAWVILTGSENFNLLNTPP